ncbi:hypothetical protein [Streptomyces sp. MA5143a]|uniref:hypothetical protein n=1 Tax=Streptomyces sp. MA5143a TaxID=2083010 RepID=UPI0015E6ECB9|nr:hypothetical protein [Streptomyces sp. MA5143a]
MTFAEPRGGAAVGEFVQVDDVPFAGAPDDEALTGQVEVGEQQVADVGAAERMDADQHRHEAQAGEAGLGHAFRGHGKGHAVAEAVVELG